MDEAAAVLEQAAQRYHVLSDLEGEARVIAEIGGQSYFRGTTDESIERIREMLRLLAGTGPPSVLAKLYRAEGAYFWSKVQFPEALRSFERALEAARRTDDARLLAMALVVTGSGKREMGQPEESIQLLQEAVTVTEASGDLYWGMRAQDFLGNAYLVTGELSLALPHYERGFELAARIENRDQMLLTRSEVGLTLLYQGAWEQARKEYEPALDLVPLAGASGGTFQILTILGSFCVAQGQWKEAEQHLGEALALSERSDDVQWRCNVLDALAEIDLLRSQPAQALARLEPVRQLQAAQPDSGSISSMLGWALLEVGETAEAAAVAHRGLDLYTAKLHRLLLPEWLELCGMVAARQGQWEEADRHLEEGLAQTRAMGMPYWEGRILYRAGLLSAERDEPEQAGEQLAQALAIFQRLGAEPYIERTEQALATL
jgi:tetratricopeptide (TPR) repeat protein